MSDAPQVDQPAPDEERACRNCAYWRNPKEGNGHCFAHPPVVMLMTMTVPPAQKSKILNAAEAQVSYQQIPGSTRPVTAGHDVCAEHRYGDEPSAIEEIAAILDSLHSQIGGITKYMGVPSGRVVAPGSTSKPTS